MKIRKLLESDKSDFVRIRLLALKDNPEAFGSTFEEECSNADVLFTARLKENNDNTVLGVFNEQNEIQGMLGIVRSSKIKSNHKVDLWGTYVLPSYRGKGAAKSLIATSIEIARKMDGVEQVRIGVVTENLIAKKLYLSFGFKVYGLEEKAFKYDNRYFNLEEMVLFL